MKSDDTPETLWIAITLIEHDMHFYGILNQA